MVIRVKLNRKVKHLFCSVIMWQILIFFINTQQIIVVTWNCLDRRRSHVSVEEQLCSCALCQDVLKDPVSTSCGHWFCRQCITSYWNQSASSGDSSCPQCGQRLRTRPASQTSSAQCKTQHLYQWKMSPATSHSIYLKTYSHSTTWIKTLNHKNQACTSAASNNWMPSSKCSGWTSAQFLLSWSHFGTCSTIVEPGQLTIMILLSCRWTLS